MKLYAACLLALLISATDTLAQNDFSVTASVDKKEILIGQQIRLTLQAKMPLGENISWFPLDTLPHFDIIEKGKIDSVTTINERTYTQQLLITSFDSGMHSIVPLPLKVNGKNFNTDSIPINIKFSHFDPKQDYHDIKDILEVPNPYSKYILMGIVVITLISVVLIVYFITRKRVEKSKGQNEISRLGPYEEAMASLDELKKQHMTQNGQVKAYYTRLNDILKVYVLRKLGIVTIDKTNEELIRQLKKTDIPHDRFSQLVQALRMSDFVKFAKYQPGENENEQHFDIIKSSIDIINEIAK
ncbi:MAG: hypothetical protein JST58_20230 [Bacteroidetes bacterium]|nr:hypothetical protein [Bacteroidota bacterium]